MNLLQADKMYVHEVKKEQKDLEKGKNANKLNSLWFSYASFYSIPRYLPIEN